MQETFLFLWAEFTPLPDFDLFDISNVLTVSIRPRYVSFIRTRTKSNPANLGHIQSPSTLKFQTSRSFHLTIISGKSS